MLPIRSIQNDGGGIDPCFHGRGFAVCVLPKILYDNHGHGLPINMTTSTGSNWCLYWGNPHTGIGWRDSNSLVDLLTEAIEWVVTKGYKLNV